jgi:undecaprenyl phosphate N,N'-diacetylbacillosamine 1-phosphate transferase
MYGSLVKRVIDFMLSLVGLIGISPFLLFFTVLLFFVNRGSPFYLHERPGRNGRIFRLIKFKTMSDRRDANGMLLSDVQRLTSVGRFMRSLSLDEFPQLINVLKGDMSLIGPRPLLVRYLPLYNARQLRRHEVRPGMTGWAQINGRNALSWQEKFEYDVWYVDNVCFLLDIKILWMTMLKVLQRDGINATDDVLMMPFIGNDTE